MLERLCEQYTRMKRPNQADDRYVMLNVIRRISERTPRTEYKRLVEKFPYIFEKVEGGKNG